MKPTTRRSWVALGVLALLFLVLFLVRWNRPESDQKTDYRAYSTESMATRFELLLPASADPSSADRVFAIFRRIDQEMSEWQPTSPLSQINAAAGVKPIAVTSELRYLLGRGLELSEITGGAFDMTWASLWGLWHFKAKSPQVPSPADIDKRRRLVDYNQVVIDDDADTVYLRQHGMKIGLGAIAKGYALDLAGGLLRREGIDSFLISGGGQILAAGLRNGQPWRIGIRDPRGAADDYFAAVSAVDTSVATSGDYERFFEQGGIRYHHILDPRTGMPARGLRSATVVAKEALVADALSTAVMVIGHERGLALIEGLTAVEAIVVDDGGQLHFSSGAKDSVTVFRSPR